MRNILLTVGVIIVVVIVGLAIFRSTNHEGEVVNEEPVLQDVTGTSEAAPGQFIQQEPSDVPVDAGQLLESVIPTPLTTSMQGSGESGEVNLSEGVTVSIEDTGFYPSSVTAEKGATVTFINNGQGLHWPASDVHPTHELLPGFDAQHGLVTGESYSFTFDNAGTWPYHDHLNPSIKGTIVVQ